jgi:hypothetical protein
VENSQLFVETITLSSHDPEKCQEVIVNTVQTHWMRAWIDIQARIHHWGVGANARHEKGTEKKLL